MKEPTDSVEAEEEGRPAVGELRWCGAACFFGGSLLDEFRELVNPLFPEESAVTSRPMDAKAFSPFPCQVCDIFKDTRYYTIVLLDASYCSENMKYY